MTIAIGTSLRPSAEALADVAARLARELDEPLRLVHVCAGPRAQALVGTDQEHLLAAERAKLQAQAERLREVTGASVAIELAAEPIVDALASAASVELASALVLGASERPLSPVPERVAARSAVPVLAVRDPAPWRAWIEGQRPLRVLIGADLGRAAQEARAWVSRLAAVGPIEAEVAWVASAERAHRRLGLACLDDEALSEEARSALLRELAAAAPPHESAELRVLSSRGRPDAALVAHAERGRFDLVVVGWRRRADAGRWRRSTARGVLRGAPASVACVPAPVDAPEASFRSPRTIVVGVDLVTFDHPALAHAIGYAGEGATIHVVHVLEAMGPGRGTDGARRHAWERLSKRLAEVPRPSSVSITPHVLEGPAAERLVGLAERVGADLIVAGACDRPATSRMLVGSVAKALAASSPRPVLLVPARGP